jgi:hypothetical protein
LHQLLCSQPNVTQSFEPFRLWLWALGPWDDDSYADKLTRLQELRLRFLYYDSLRPNSPLLVSKDPRDCLRVGLLASVFPSSRFVHIVRDGRDVIASIIKIWQGVDYRTDTEYDWVHVKIPGYQQLASKPHHIKAALMWVNCVRAASGALCRIPEGRWTNVRYEDLVLHPAREAHRILRFAFGEYDRHALDQLLPLASMHVIRSKTKHNGGDPSKDIPSANIRRWVQSNVENDAGSGSMSETVRVGKWKTELTKATLAACEPIIAPLLRELNYS